MRDVLVKNIAELYTEAELYAESLTPGHQATIIGLSGDLGSGKTAFVKSIGKVVGVGEEITSPTFVIQKTYPIHFQGFTRLVHIDAYRLESSDDMRPLMFADACKEPGNLICIEWPENIKVILPNTVLWLSFEVVDETTRRITFPTT